MLPPRKKISEVLVCIVLKNVLVCVKVLATFTIFRLHWQKHTVYILFCFSSHSSSISYRAAAYVGAKGSCCSSCCCSSTAPNDNSSPKKWGRRKKTGRRSTINTGPTGELEDQWEQCTAYGHAEAYEAGWGKKKWNAMNWCVFKVFLWKNQFLLPDLNIFIWIKSLVLNIFTLFFIEMLL